ncbi:MAG: DUF2004 domain-containing protein [Saprospiraceae bacterium]|nr:DUF2004 domain-containing protein [Saprospiraceae bacterium]
MTVIEFSRIGPVKLKKKEDEYVFEDWTITYQLEGQPLDLDIHLKELDDSSIAIVNIVLTELEKIRDIGQSALVKNFEEGDVVKDYIEEWNEDIFFQVFEEDEFQDFIKDTAPSLSIEERLLSLLRLVRVGIYRNSKDHLLTLDFAFGHGDEEGFRQHMFVLWLNEDYELVDMGIEG